MEKGERAPKRDRGCKKGSKGGGSKKGHGCEKEKECVHKGQGVRKMEKGFGLRVR